MKRTKFLKAVLYEDSCSPESLDSCVLFMSSDWKGVGFYLLKEVVYHNDRRFFTTVYHRPSDTGLGMNFMSFNPSTFKYNSLKRGRIHPLFSPNSWRGRTSPDSRGNMSPRLGQPLDHYFWGRIVGVACLNPDNSIITLKRSMKRAIDTVDKAEIIHAVSRFRSRVEAVVANEGGHIECYDCCQSYK